MADFEHFDGGSPSVRRKLNEQATFNSSMAKIRGDEVFIAVRNTFNGGVTVSLNINQVLARIPKTTAPPYITFAVKLEKVSGSIGSLTTKASYIYIVYDLDGNVLDDTDVSPIGPKAPRTVGELVGPAVRGLACWDENNDLSLEMAYEEYATGNCPTPP